MMRRCPQCGSAGDDIYGFCIKCGYEFPKVEHDEHTCPLCGFTNPDEADYCVKCGSPLIFKKSFENQENVIKPIVVKKEFSTGLETEYKKTSRLLIFIGYFFAVLGSIIGLLIAIYLITRKDPSAKRHGYIQIAIILFYLVIIAVLFMTGSIPPEVLTDYKSLLIGNFTSFHR